MIIERFVAKSKERIAPGRHEIVVETILDPPRSGSPATVVLRVDGREVARTTTKMTVPAAFTASESLDIGVDLGSTVSRDYYDRRPFTFSGKIEKVTVKYASAK
jgi:arylsulfatase